MKKTSVFLVDDSALVRQLTTEILSREPDIEVIGSAPDPIAAQQKLETLTPDVILLDIEMPRMDGLQFLHLLKQTPHTSHIPVLMFSSLTQLGCEHTLKALERGAVDFVTKPKLDLKRGFEDLAIQVVTKVRAAALSKRPAKSKPGSPPSSILPSQLQLKPAAVDLIAIGCSTGGTEALREIFSLLPADLPPIVIVQHMPEHFTHAFAQRLDKVGAVRVKEAEDSDKLCRGRAWLAPGNRHMEITKAGGVMRTRLTDGLLVNGHRPSVDVLFHSCQKATGAQTIGVILTGMGTDGARGLLALRQSGAFTIAQNEESCVVFGMPKEAILCGAVASIAPIGSIAQFIAAHCQTQPAEQAPASPLER